MTTLPDAPGYLLVHVHPQGRSCLQGGRQVCEYTPRLRTRLVRLCRRLVGAL